MYENTRSRLLNPHRRYYNRLGQRYYPSMNGRVSSYRFPRNLTSPIYSNRPPYNSNMPYNSNPNRLYEQNGGSFDANNIIEAVRFTDPRTFVIFYDPQCRYSINALEFLRSNGMNYKSYNISDIPGGMNSLLRVFNDPSSGISFNPQHRTKPIIFLQAALVGGYSELVNKYG